MSGESKYWDGKEASASFRRLGTMDELRARAGNAKPGEVRGPESPSQQTS